MRRRPLAIAAALLAGALLAGGGASVLFTSGGPPPAEPSPGVKAYHPVAEWWRLVSTASEGGGVLCTHAEPCAADALKAAAAEGGACAWEAGVWLASESVPVVVRGVRGNASVVVVSGDLEPLGEGRVNVTTHTATLPAPSPEGWWWRAEAERVRVAAPTPCDAREVTFTLNYAGATLTGQPWEGAQTVKVALLGSGDGAGADGAT